MTILRRTSAPITETEWSIIDSEARDVLDELLVARRFVDIKGPHGWDYSAYNLGALEEGQTTDSVEWSLRSVRPLIELRVPFSVDRKELDNIARGAPQIELGAVVKAAQQVALFEENTLYRGLAGAGIKGLLPSTTHAPVDCSAEPESVLNAVAQAMICLSNAGVEGPYMLVLGEKKFRAIASNAEHYPLLSQLEELLGHPPIFSRGLETGLLVSTRGGDFILSLGVDLSIGFDRLEGSQIHLYLTESFTFDVPGAEAVAILQHGG